MAIDYRGLRSLTAKELISALERDGFYLHGREDLISATGILMAGVSRWSTRWRRYLLGQDASDNHWTSGPVGGRRLKAA